MTDNFDKYSVNGPDFKGLRAIIEKYAKRQMIATDAIMDLIINNSDDFNTVILIGYPIVYIKLEGNPSGILTLSNKSAVISN